jgi:DNA-binding LacI/PurR family transcriptional regulator
VGGVSHDDARGAFIQALAERGFTGQVAVAAHTDASAHDLRETGADLVMQPFRDAAFQAARLILDNAHPEPAQLPDPAGQRELVS